MLIARIGFGIWPKYWGSEQGWIMYLGVTIVYVFVMFLSFESNRGFLVILSTIVSGTDVTFFIYFQVQLHIFGSLQYPLHMKKETLQVILFDVED